MKYFFTQNELNMRQRRWLELIEDYDCSINYHAWKANVVANVVSRKTVRKEIKEDMERNDIKFPLKGRTA